jgi:hypothetical protein
MRAVVVTEGESWVNYESVLLDEATREAATALSAYVEECSGGMQLDLGRWSRFADHGVTGRLAGAGHARHGQPAGALAPLGWVCSQ